MVLLLVMPSSAVVHELQHAKHHNAGMHGSGICAWLCAAATTHVATPVHWMHVFGFVSLPPSGSHLPLVIQLTALTRSRAPPDLV